MLRPFKAVLLLLAPVFLWACAVSVPVNENQPPETLGAGGIRLKVGAGTTPVIGFDAGSGAINTGGAYTINNSFGLDIGVFERLDLQLYDAIASPGNAGTVGLKCQWKGDSYFKVKSGEWSSSFSAKAIYADMPSFNSGGGTFVTNYYKDVNGSGFEVSNSWGYRATSWAGFYLGPKAVNLTISGQVDPNGTGNYGPESRNVTGVGGFFGIYLAPHTSYAGLEFTFEAQMMNFPGSYSSDRAWYPATYSMGFAVPFKL